jgi:integrase
LFFSKEANMSRTANTPLKTCTQRDRLAARTAPYFNTIAPKRLLGYIRRAGGRAGSWVVQVEIGRTETGKPVRRREQRGIADDVAEANGTDVLSYQQALAAAIAWQPGGPNDGPKSGAFTVRDAVEQHRDFGGKSGNKAERNKLAAYNNLRYHVLGLDRNNKPRPGVEGLGHIAVNDLTDKILKEWRDDLVDPENPGSHANARRIWGNLHSCLEQAYRKKENGITSSAAWDALQAMPATFQSRFLHFTDAQAVAIVEHVRAVDAPAGDYLEGLYRTGARPGAELWTLTVADFSHEMKRISIHGRDENICSKTGERHPDLDVHGVAFFAGLVAGRPHAAPIFSPDGDRLWQKADRARIKTVLVSAVREVLGTAAPQDDDAIVPYCMRHTFISRRVSAGMPSKIVADQCGTSEAMINKTYAKSLRSERERWMNATAPQPVLRVVNNDEQRPEVLKEAA